MILLFRMCTSKSSSRCLDGLVLGVSKLEIWNFPVLLHVFPLLFNDINVKKKTTPFIESVYVLVQFKVEIGHIPRIQEYLTSDRRGFFG